MSRPSRFGAFLALVAASGLWAACQNAGEGKVLGISATGTVNGFVFWDRNGNRAPDPADTTLSNLPVRLVVQGTRDTAARGSSSASGRFNFTNLPVGTYTLVVDTAILGDSLRVIRVDTSTITLRPDDTLAVQITVAFPQLTIAQARAAPLGKKMFIAGVALISRGLFGDTTLHLGDATSAIRMTAVKSAVVFIGDSIRALGTRSTRDGQPTLNQATIFPLSTDADPPFQVVSTVTASGASGGSLDAGLVRVLNAAITDTATVQGNRRLMVNDNSGLLEVRLDTLVGFRALAIIGDTVGARIDVLGVLIPIGPGAWRLKPRAPSDVVQR